MALVNRIRQKPFFYKLLFWGGCTFILIGVLSHIPMFLCAAPMGFHMAGMPMSTTMLTGMMLIPVGLFFSGYGLVTDCSKEDSIKKHDIQLHIADDIPLNLEHCKLICALFVAVAVDVMKPATLGFVIPGMTNEYGISDRTAGALVFVALTGTAIGSVIWGVASDRYGRRATILLSALMFIGTSICGAMPSFGWNLAMCFLMGLSAGGLLPITFALMAETVPSRHRGWTLVALGGLGTGAGYLLASGAAAILEPTYSWRSLWLLGLPTGFLIILLKKYIPESPRYLARKGRLQEARSVLARFGGSISPGINNVTQESIAGTEQGFNALIKGRYSLISGGLVIAGLAWGIVNFGFLLWLPTNLRDLGFGHYADILIAQSATVALPGMAFVIALYHLWSSIYTLVFFLTLIMVSMLIFCFISWMNVYSMGLLFTATTLLLISSSGVIAMLIPYAAEIYPLELRGTGVGVIAGSSKVGGIIGALLGLTGIFRDISISAFFIVFLVIISGSILIKTGINTRGLRLEDIQNKLLVSD